MNAEHWGGLAVGVLLLAYLAFTLLRPEKL